MMLFRRATLIAVGLTLVAVACSEPASPTNVPVPVTSQPDPTTPPAPQPVKTDNSVFATAGLDVLLAFPSRTATLSGYGRANEGKIVSYSWMKLSGAGSSTLLTPTSKETQVADLQLGSHEFELTITDDKGRSGRDTVRVFVYEPLASGPHEIVVHGEWGCFGFCFLSLAVFQPVIPDKSAIKVFLRTGDQWMEINEEPSPGSDPLWSFQNGSHGGTLWIVSGTEYLVGREDVKIVF